MGFEKEQEGSQVHHLFKMQHYIYFFPILGSIFIIFILDWIFSQQLSTAMLYVIPLHFAAFKIANRRQLYMLYALTLCMLTLACGLLNNQGMQIAMTNYLIVGFVITSCFFTSLKFKKLTDELFRMRRFINESSDFLPRADIDGNLLHYKDAHDDTVRKHKTENPVSFSGIHGGINEHRNPEQRAKLLLDILDKSSDLIYQMDIHKTIIFANKSLKSQIGVADKSSLDLEAIHPDSSIALLNSRIIPQLMKKGHWEGELSIFSDSNENLQTSAVYMIHRDIDGRIIAFSAIMRDISDKLRNIDYQKALNLQLEHTVKELERSNSDLDHFTYIAGHDLRSPLRGIENLSRWILEDKGNTLSQRSKEDMVKLQDRARKLHKLLEGLLRYSRVDRLEQSIGSVSPHSFIGEIIDFIAPPDGYKVEVSSVVETISIKCAPFKTVLMNLIGNAVKHRTSDQGKVEVHVKEDNDWIRIHVSDDGEGIPEKHHKRIFEMFKTLKSPDNDESSGIGLAIVKKVVEREGGKISVKNNAGAGVTFSLDWPKDQVPKPSLHKSVN